MDLNIKNKPWYSYLERDLQELLEESLQLIKDVPTWDSDFHDYSFIVFPSAKAYEGFLKKMFIDLGFITRDDYYGRHFRIGKALNPQLEEKFREKESVYDKIVNFLKDKQLADELWETWKNCRNLIFHWFPDEKNAVSFEEAVDRVEEIIYAIDNAYKNLSS
jgi:hypothetical protein